ncbi:MAG: hypothetical protein EOO20_06245 [Chryseobacterium sp.]|nr:MAG: hypothetical protein EOO20_06245 [Chryseobacterium sp.]
MSQKNIEGNESAFNYPLPIPYIQKNWLGKEIKTIDTLSWNYCTMSVASEIIEVLKELPLSDVEDPNLVMTLMESNSERITYIIVKAYEGIAEKQPDQKLIKHISTTLPLDDLLQLFFMAYKSVGMEYFMAAIQIVKPTASILKPEDHV